MSNRLVVAQCKILSHKIRNRNLTREGFPTFRLHGQELLKDTELNIQENLECVDVTLDSYFIHR